MNEMDNAKEFLINYHNNLPNDWLYEKSEVVARLIEEYHQAKLKNNVVLDDVMPSLQTLNFREMRKAKGLTLRKVEEITGLSNAYLSQLETGKVKSPGYNVVKILYDLYSNEA